MTEKIKNTVNQIQAQLDEHLTNKPDDPYAVAGDWMEKKHDLQAQLRKARRELEQASPVEASRRVYRKVRHDLRQTVDHVKALNTEDNTRVTVIDAIWIDSEGTFFYLDFKFNFHRYDPETIIFTNSESLVMASTYSTMAFRKVNGEILLTDMRIEYEGKTRARFVTIVGELYPEAQFKMQIPYVDICCTRDFDDFRCMINVAQVVNNRLRVKLTENRRLIDKQIQAEKEARLKAEVEHKARVQILFNRRATITPQIPENTQAFWNLTDKQMAGVRPYIPVWFVRRDDIIPVFVIPNKGTAKSLLKKGVVEISPDYPTGDRYQLSAAFVEWLQKTGNISDPVVIQ